MAHDLLTVSSSDDFIVTIDSVLQSWMDIRRDVDSSAYMHKSCYRGFEPSAQSYHSEVC